MRCIYAIVITLALLVATPGLAIADPYTRPVGNQRAIDFVIARGLSQRGVPYTYGGGNAAGPTRGTAPAPSATGIQPGATVVGIDPGASVTAVDPGTNVTESDPAANVVGFDASGLMVYAFAGVGVKVPRSSGEQYKVGLKISPAQALPGDLIFYGPDGSKSVAMFWETRRCWRPPIPSSRFRRSAPPAWLHT